MGLCKCTGYVISSIPSYTQDGFRIESISDTNIVTLNENKLTLVNKPTSVESLLGAINISDKASAKVYANADCGGNPITTGDIGAGYALKVSSGTDASCFIIYQIE